MSEHKQEIKDFILKLQDFQKLKNNNNITNVTEKKSVNEEWRDIGDERTIEIKREKKPLIRMNFGSKILILKTDDGRLSRFKSKDSFPKPELVDVENIKKGYFLLEEVPIELNLSKTIIYKYKTFFEEKTNVLQLEPDSMRSIGYWLAEGSLAKTEKGSNEKNKLKNLRKIPYYKYRVDFAFNVNEKEYIQDVKNLIKKYFGVSSTTHITKNTNGTQINCNTRAGYEFFNQFFGSGAKNKKIPEYFVNLEKKLLKQLIKGFWRGDGSLGCQELKNRRTHFSICSVSGVMIEQFRKILLRFKVNPSVWVRTPEKHRSNIVNGRLVKAKNDLHTLAIYGNNAEILNSILNENYGNFSSRDYIFFTPDNKYAIYPIRSVQLN